MDSILREANAGQVEKLSEVLRKRTHFTVNIAYVEKGVLVSGLIYAPKHGELFWGTDQGAFKALRSEAFAANHQIRVDRRVDEPRIVVSGSRDMDRVNEFVAVTGGVLEHVGASLKYGRIAAGNAILLAAGGGLLLLDGGDLTYGKGDWTTEAGSLNPPFYASSSAELFKF